MNDFTISDEESESEFELNEKKNKPKKTEGKAQE